MLAAKLINICLSLQIFLASASLAEMSLEKDEDCNHDKEHEMREESLAPLTWSHASVHPHCSHINPAKGAAGLPDSTPPSRELF